MRKVELVTEDVLENRLRQSLEKRQMPDYFLYLGRSGVRNWLNLSQSGEFPVASRLTDLLRQSMPHIVQHLPASFDLVSIGVGSGEKERLLLESLEQGRALTYYPVDISSMMVEEALNTAAGIGVNMTGLVAPLEDLALLRNYWNSPILLCLLGNNFCNYDPDYLLATLREQLEFEDLLLFDCHLLPVRQESQESARERVEQVYRSRLNMLFNIDPLVQRGLNPDNCAFYLNLVPLHTDLGKVYRTCKWLQILNDTTVSCGSEKVSLSAGETISLGFTYKHTCPQVKGYLKRHCFQEVQLFLDPEGNNLLALVRKRPA